MTKPQAVPASFFPTANSSAATGTTSDSHHELSDHPTEISAILDPLNSNKPLIEFDHALRHFCYGDETTATTVDAVAPPQPEAFNDPYLFPYLSHNECLRLTLLWYYTRLITKNHVLMSKIQGLLTIVQKFMGWEFALVGLVDEAVFTRLAAINMPLAMLPRRESPCSHTINQAPGTVFSIPNMEADWRFKSSPYVAIGGLRSYAGTQLRIKTESGEEVALGSLCIASSSVQKPLNEDQKSSLVRFAEIITMELVDTLRQNRIREKEQKLELLLKLKEATDISETDLKDRLIALIQSFYPDASVTIQTSQEHAVSLGGDLKINFKAVRAGLWEDTALIYKLIQTLNHAKLHSKQTVRSIVGKCGHFNVFVVVASCNIQHVFDDYDAWFIETCAQIMTDSIHRRELQEALLAKEAFLRGITHQLRTPIHGLLASSELLGEVLASPGMSTTTGQELQRSIQESALAHVGTIQQSGIQLMATVNDLLKFNSWSRNMANDLKPTLYDLHLLEKDVMDRLRESISEPLNSDVMLSFEVRLAPERDLVMIDAGILQDALQPLIVNALQATTSGSITIRVSAGSESSTLQFEILDTGSGIPSADRARIFQPFEKGSISIHQNGVGLGLTLAVKAAHLLGGAIRLVSSEVGTGSHFLIEIPDLVFVTKETVPEKYLENEDSAQRNATSQLQASTISTESDPIPTLCSLTLTTQIVGKTPTSPRALLVDDNAINLKVLRMYCEKRAIPYLLATNGQEAIDQFKMAQETDTSPINLILMDLQMPVCGGLEACTSIRAFEAANALPPSKIFIITGQDSRNDRLRSVEAGSDEFLVKPVSLKLLDKHLAKYNFR
ncbi:hypothetical protein LTR84_011409 [Exophiala bonariae]|uniref:histidine kinase n=1 Tax=Exophiala bonariae TaxID=1690606 RepID=A0AAV9MS41_9EURO|nr:hypothetical protein LTR84_011409 [Exophiala bonariae]